MERREREEEEEEEKPQKAVFRLVRRAGDKKLGDWSIGSCLEHRAQARAATDPNLHFDCTVFLTA